MGKLLKLAMLAVFVISFAFAAGAAEKVTVFAASSTTDMMTELIDMYNKAGGNVIASFASSGALARQIEAGAPADIFVSANQEWMEYLDGKDMIAYSKDWLGNTLVLIAPKDSKITYKFAKGNYLSKVTGRGKLAIGDPAHVPAGTYAKQALENLGIWADIEKNVAAAENVRAVLLLVSRGEAPLGIVFGSDMLAAADRVKIIDSVPQESFEKISYPMGMIKGRNNAEAKKFYEFLQSTGAKVIINKYGFTLL